MPFDLSFIGRGLLPFQGSTNTTPDVPGTAPGATDPQDELLQQLLAGLGTIPEPTAPQMPLQPSGGRQIIGNLGDAILAMAAVRAGGQPQAMGPFAARQHEAAQMAQLQQQEYERRREEVAIANQTMKRQTLIGLMAERGRNRIGPLDQAKLDLDRQQAAETERYHTGMLNKQPAPTAINPETERHNREMERLDAERLKLVGRARPLPASLAGKIADQTSALEAATNAMKQWTDLGKPDLGWGYQHTPDRFANTNAIRASAIISEALVPLRKYFLGAAVSPTEAAAAAPLIAQLEKGVAPNVLEASLNSLISLAERARRNELQSAEMGGFDVSKFSTATAKAAPGNRNLRVVIDANGDLKVEE